MKNTSPETPSGRATEHSGAAFGASTNDFVAGAPQQLSILRRANFWIILLIDTAILAGCYFTAGLLRFEGAIPAETLDRMAANVVPLIACKLACFFAFDLYRGMWRYTGISDLIAIIKAALAGSLLYVAFLAMSEHFRFVSRGIILIDLLLTILAVAGFRLAIRLFYQRHSASLDELMFRDRARSGARRVLIVGTGARAEKLMREIHEGHTATYRVAGFIETGHAHSGLKIHGVPILGSMEDIPRLVTGLGIEDILIADSGLKHRDVAALMEACADCRVRFRVIPSFEEEMKKGAFGSLRDIRIEDLMEREPVRIDMGHVRSEIEGRRILVSGAGGSIGSELCRQILSYEPAELLLVDNAETPLYNIEIELNALRPKGSEVAIVPCICDVRSLRSMEQVFRRHRPDLVYHAAAYKHVPMMERSPLEAMNTNILGTFKLATLACRHHVRKFVLISTDKAVRPTSVMGATKRVAELVAQTLGGNGTRFIVVRFGNVLGSNGSVVPLFQQQIASGGPVTVTHPEITRYFMTIPEAVMLVLQAGAIGNGGELFLLDMGRPVKIADMARNMIRLAGLVPERDVKIAYIGLRPGEKLHEELLIEGEGIVDTPYEKIKVCSTCSRVDEERLFEGIEHMNLLVKNSGEADAALAILERLVPDFKRDTGDDGHAARAKSLTREEPEEPRLVEY